MTIPTSSTTLDAALTLAANGWSVLPCRPTGQHAKAPLTVHGHQDATIDPAVIRGWWARWPAALIGARVPSTLLVLDLDPRNDGSMTALETLVGPLPPTLTVWSGRGDGGRHHYFTRPAGTVTSTRLPIGWDLKVNGYCIMPPSPHPDTGMPYRWDERRPAPLPPRLRELLRPPQVVPRVRSHAPARDGHALVEFVAWQAHGNVNDALYWAARRAAESGILTDALARELVHAAGHAAGAYATAAGERQSWRTVESARKAV